MLDYKLYFISGSESRFHEFRKKAIIYELFGNEELILSSIALQATFTDDVTGLNTCMR